MTFAFCSCQGFSKAWLACALVVFWTTTGWGTPPFLETPIPDTSLHKGDSLEISMLEYFTDIEDGELLGLLDWQAKPSGLVSLQAKGRNRLIVKAGGFGVGQALVTVRVTDAEQLIASDSFTVTIMASGIQNHAPQKAAQGHIRIMPVSGRILQFRVPGRGGLLFRIVDSFGRSVCSKPIPSNRLIAWDARGHGVGAYFAIVDGKNSCCCRFVLVLK